MRKQAPCKDCKERHYSCWDSCEKMIEWKKNEEIINARIKQQKKNESDVTIAVIESIERRNCKPRRTVSKKCITI